MYFTDNYIAAQLTEFHGFISHKSKDFRLRMTKQQNNTLSSLF